MHGQMCGWVSRADVWISRRNRSADLGSKLGIDTLSGHLRPCRKSSRGTPSHAAAADLAIDR